MKIITISTNLNKIGKIIQISNNYDVVYFTVGVHPNEVLKDKDIMKQNHNTIKDYELRIKQSPSKLKSLDSQYKDQNRIKFQLDLKLKESVRNLELLKKRSEIFESLSI